MRDVTDVPSQTPREQTRKVVTRSSRLLAGLAVAATAAFGVVIAAEAEHGPSTADGTAGTGSSVVGDDGFGFSPSSGVWSTTNPPSATSGGS